MKLSPWFSLKHDGPPVNGGMEARYLYRCFPSSRPLTYDYATRRSLINRLQTGDWCDFCEWCGVLKEGSE